MSNYTIRVVLDGQDNASDDFRRVSGSMDNLKRKNQEVTQSNQGLVGSFQNVNQQMKLVETAVFGMGTAFAGLQVARIAGDLFNAGEEARKTGNAFLRAAGDAAEANDVLSRLTDTIKHVDDTTLQRTFTDFRDVLKLSNDDATELIQTVTKLNRFGEDAGTFFTNTLSALKNQRTNLLDNLGINVGEFRDIRDELLGSGVDSATAFMEAFKIAAGDAADEFGALAEQNVSALDRLQTGWANLQSTAEMQFATLVVMGAEILSGVLQGNFDVLGLARKGLGYPSDEHVQGLFTTNANMPNTIRMSESDIISASQGLTLFSENMSSITGVLDPTTRQAFMDFIAPFERQQELYQQNYNPNTGQPFQRGLDYDPALLGDRFGGVNRMFGNAARTVEREFSSVARIFGRALEENTFNVSMLSDSSRLYSQVALPHFTNLAVRGGSVLPAVGFDGRAITPEFATRRMAGFDTVSDGVYNELQRDLLGIVSARHELESRYEGANAEEVRYLDSFRDSILAVEQAAQSAVDSVVPLSQALQALTVGDIYRDTANPLQQGMFQDLLPLLPPEMQASFGTYYDTFFKPNNVSDQFRQNDLPAMLGAIAQESGDYQAFLSALQFFEGQRQAEALNLTGQASLDQSFSHMGMAWQPGVGGGGSFRLQPGETLSHYYSGADLQAVLGANPGLNPRNISPFTDISLPGSGGELIPFTGADTDGLFDALVADAQSAGDEAGAGLASGIEAGTAAAAGAVDTIQQALDGLQGTYSVVVSVKYEVDPTSDMQARADAERGQRQYNQYHNVTDPRIVGDTDTNPQ